VVKSGASWLAKVPSVHLGAGTTTRAYSARCCRGRITRHAVSQEHLHRILRQNTILQKRGSSMGRAMCIQAPVPPKQRKYGYGLDDLASRNAYRPTEWKRIGASSILAAGEAGCTCLSSAF
jgi:hypothetical protein